MGLLGALVGGSLGFMMGGPLGAMIGGAVGSRLGEGGSASSGGFQGRSYAGGSARIHSDPRAAQTAFMVALISLAAKVAKADGRVTREEVKAFDSFLRERMGMPAADRRVAGRIFNEARDSNVPASAFTRQIRELLGHQPDRLRDLISLLMQVAMADGAMHPAEESLIRSIAGDLGLSERDYAEARAMFTSGGAAAGNESYDILGVSPTATEAEVKKAYRRLAREYHPDVITSKGLPEDFMTFATEKLQKVNEAYDRIKKERGF